MFWHVFYIDWSDIHLSPNLDWSDIHLSPKLDWSDIHLSPKPKNGKGHSLKLIVDVEITNQRSILSSLSVE